MKALILVLLLAGCASTTGIEMTDAEAKACQEQGCTVWTLQELTGLAKKFFRDGYLAGVKSL